MKLGLINSAWAQAGRETAYGIRMTKEIGFDSIDIFTDPLDIDVKERRLIKRECDKAGLPIVSIACVAVGLIDFNPSVQQDGIPPQEQWQIGVRHLRELGDYAANLGVQIALELEPFHLSLLNNV